MIETIEFRGRDYPKLQSTGFAARFAFPFAQEICKGHGLDIGCGRLEWCFPGAVPVDPEVNSSYDWEAMSLPNNFKDHSAEGWDYIFSSHCLEHLPDWVGALDYWHTKLRPGGVLFLYLPHPSQDYWLPWNNRKHLHSLSPELLRDYFWSFGTDDGELKERRPIWSNIFVTEHDLNNSFYAIAEKS